MMTYWILCKQWNRWRQELKTERKKQWEKYAEKSPSKPAGKSAKYWPVLTGFIGLILGTKMIKHRRALKPLGQQLLSTPCQCPSIEPTATCLFTGGLRKQELRDCKGIKILLAIGSSSHRSEYFLPQLDVFCNLRLSRVSFLWVCFCCPAFQYVGLLLTSTVLGFLCFQLPPWELSRSWASAVLGLCIMGAKPRFFQSGKVQEMAP